MEFWSLLENPKGNVYKRLIQILCLNSDRFYFITHKYSDYNNVIIEKFQTYILELCKSNKWGITKSLGSAPNVYIIEANNSTCSLLLENANSLYDWNNPLPEDLTFLKKNDTWFVSIAHEKEGGFYIYADDQRELLKQIPGLVIEKSILNRNKPYFIDKHKYEVQK